MHFARISVVVAALLVVATTLPAAGASTTPRLPTSAADWATFSEAERDAAMRFEREQLESASAAGVVPNEVHSGEPEPSASSSVAPAGIVVEWQCQLQWIDTLEGTWARGGGWTDTSQPVYRIYASRPGKKGQFLRDGGLLANWYEEKIGGGPSHAENWTGYNFKWWFEHPHYVVKGWHGAQKASGGTWLLGPDRYCTVNKTL